MDGEQQQEDFTLDPQRVEASWEAWNVLKKQIKTGNLLVIDGGTGSEVSARQPEALNSGYSCTVHLDYPDLIRSIHETYVKAGAHIIITNNYATNRNILTAAGCPEKTEAAIKVAVEVAREARKNVGSKFHDSLDSFQPPWIAGSISTHPPDFTPGVPDYGYFPPKEELSSFREAAFLQANSGIDFFFMEMMKEMTHSKHAITSAAETGMPMFIGLSTRLRNDGVIVLWGQMDNEETRLPFTQERFNEILSWGGECVVGINIMHTSHEAVLPTLKLVREYGWTGCLGAYPDHGTYKPTGWGQDGGWEHMELNMEEARQLHRLWVSEAGVSMIGGCCGLGPDYIENVAEFARQHNDQVRGTDVLE